MITKKKRSYEGPVCEVFEVQMEAVMQANSPNSLNNRNHTEHLLGGSSDPDNYDEL